MDAHFPPAGHAAWISLNAFRTPAQVRLIFEEFFLFQLGLMLRKRAAVREAEAARDPGRRSHPRVGARDSAVPAHRRAEERAEGDRRRHAAPDADEPPAAGRRRRRQDDRRAAGGARRHGERPAGGVHGADRNSRRAAFPQPPGAAGAIALPRRAASPAPRPDCAGAICWRGWRRATSTWSSARTRSCRAPSISTRLGLAIIDEQHRFGVVQRATLRAKGLMPDVLVMTATPIPRTLALTVYGDLDVSVIRDMPPGRRAILTTVKPESRREDVYELVRTQLERRTAGLCRLSADRGVGKGRSEGGDGDG